MGKMKFIMFVGLLMLMHSSWAQIAVTGKVTDTKDGLPLGGVTVNIRNTDKATVTGSDGTFSLTAPANATLVFTYVGYQTLERSSAKGFVNVALTQGDNALSEVVVTGYTTIQRKKYAGAITSVSTAEVRKQTFGSFDQALQGQASGVSVQANSGQPGANAVVRIRGNGSVNGSNVPLYIMDGIEISAADFSSVNQGDFERVEVLKDAVATAQYGSRGANGVIVITTRRGRAGQLQLTYDMQIGTSKLPEDRLIVMNSQQKIDYELQRGNPYGWTPAEADSLRKVNFDWRDALFQTGKTQQHQISASGGSQASRLYASLSYFDQEGIVKTTGLKRYTARINVDNTVKNFRFGLNLQGGYSKQIGTGEGNTFLSSPLNAIRWSNPYERDIDPRTGDYQETGGPNTGQLGSGQPNAAMELFLNYNNNLQIKGVAVSYLEFHFPSVPGLFARTNWGIDYGQNESTGFTSPRTSVGIARQGILSRSMNRNLRYTGTTSLNYKKDFGKHELEGGVFTEVVKSNFRNFGFTGYGLTNGFTNEFGITPGSATNPNYIPAVAGNGSMNGILSYFSILNYGYSGKYYATLVGRRDGSSRFGVNKRWANFGSAGLTWVASEESFVQNLRVFNDLKFRVSVGTTGNQGAGDFPIPIFGRSAYAGAIGLTPSQPGNLDLTWETNRTINLGVDFGILKRRLTGTVELYERKTLDLFFPVPIDPSSSGFLNIPSNFGKLSNRGIEIMLKGDIIKSKSFNWSMQGNFTYNRNRILDLPKDSTISGITILAKGKPVNSLYLVQYAGVDPTNGNAQYTKRDKTVTNIYSVNDRVILGTSDAPYFGGISTTVSYKGLDVGAQLNFFFGRDVFNNDRVNVTDPSYFFDNMSVDLLKEWRNPGDITNVPRPSAGTVGGTAPANPFRSNTTRFVEDASFWRLRNVTIGYTVPASLLSKAKIKSARIFLQGQNLWTSTEFKSFDPEFTGASLTGAQYPALKQTTLGVSISF